jgi:hypothetical protein
LSVKGGGRDEGCLRKKRKTRDSLPDTAEGHRSRRLLSVLISSGTSQARHLSSEKRRDHTPGRQDARTLERQNASTPPTLERRRTAGKAKWTGGRQREGGRGSVVLTPGNGQTAQSTQWNTRGVGRSRCREWTALLVGQDVLETGVRGCFRLRGSESLFDEGEGPANGNPESIAESMILECGIEGPFVRSLHVCAWSASCKRLGRLAAFRQRRSRDRGLGREGDRPQDSPLRNTVYLEARGWAGSRGPRALELEVIVPIIMIPSSSLTLMSSGFSLGQLLIPMAGHHGQNCKYLYEQQFG